MTEEFESLSCQELVAKLVELFDGGQEEEVDECLDWFLFTYSPEHAFNLVQTNAEALKDPVLLDVTMSKIRDIYEPEIFLETMNVLASIGSYEQDIAKSGAVRATIVMMNRDLHNTRSQSLGCKVLANLSHDPEVREWIGKVKGITRVIEALRRHQQTNDVAIECCRTLGNLTFQCPPNKSLVISEHGIEALLETITMHKSSVKLVNSGLRALRNIASTEEVMELQQDKLIKEVMIAMQDHRAISDIQVHGTWIVINLMSKKQELKSHMLEQGALEQILNAMETHRLDEEVQLGGCTALGLACKLSANRQTIGTTGRGISLIKTAMQTHRSSVGVQRVAIKAIFRLSFNKPVREKLGLEEIVTEIAEAMKAHPENAPLQRGAIICLLQLSKTPQLRDRIQKDCVALMIQARNRFSEIQHVASVAHRAVESLVISGASPVSPAKEAESNIEKEIQKVKSKILEKEAQQKRLQETIQHLESEVESLKEFNASSDKDENEKTVVHEKEDGKGTGDNKELEEIKKQKDNLVKGLQTVEQETKATEAQLELIKQHLLEEEKLLKELQASGSDDITKKKKSRSKGLITTKANSTPKSPKDKKEIINGNAATGQRKEFRRKGTARPKKPKQEGEEKKEKDEKKPEKKSDRERKNSEEKRAEVKTDEKKNDETKTDIDKKSDEKKHEEKKPEEDKKDEGVSPKPKKSISKKKTDDGHPSKPPSPSPAPPPVSAPRATDMNLDGEGEAVIAKLGEYGKKTSRSLLRKPRVHQEQQINDGDELFKLRKEMEQMTKLLELKDKELTASLEENKKLDATVKKVTNDFRAVHILIQTLQKESYQQTQNREALNASDREGSSVLQRQQKKIKQLKDRVNALEEENKEMRAGTKDLPTKPKK